MISTQRSNDHSHRYTSQHSQNNPNTKYISADEYSKSKIAELQDEAMRLRKQITQRECIWGKEKNHLLSKAELLNLEIAQLKQRQMQLLKVNQTLEMALESSKEQSFAVEDGKQIKELQQELANKSKNIKELKKMNEDLKRKLSIVEEEKSRVTDQKDRKIDALTTSNRQLQMDHQNRINSLKKELTSLPLNREILSSILRIVNIHFHPQQLTYQDLQTQNYYESPVTKRFQSNKEWTHNNQRQRNSDNSFSRISGHSIISELNGNKLASECSEQEQGEKLLCQVCRKVYAEREFINHMDDCNRTKLYQDRIRIEKDLRDLDNEHRKSHSQLKRKLLKQSENPLRQITPNSNLKMQKRASKQASNSYLFQAKQSSRPSKFY